MNYHIKRITPPLILLLLTILYFWQPIFGNEVLCFRDLALFNYPLRHRWITELVGGQLPFLNASLNSGQPVLANPNNSVFYPGNLLYLILPFPVAWNLTLAGHVFWGGLGVYWLGRLLGCRRFAALSGGIVFAFGGPFLSCTTYYILLITASWLPWVCASSILAYRKAGSWLVVSAVALAIQFLSGEPTTFMFTSLLLGIGWGLVILNSPKRVPLAIRALLIASGALLLAAIQILPTLEWLPHSQRGQGLSFHLSAAYWSLHPARLVEFLVPHFYGNSMGISVVEFWGGHLSDGSYPYIPKLYAGWLPLVFLPAAFRERWGRVGVLIFLLGILLSFGRHLPGYEFLFNLLPPFRIVRYPEKFLVFALFGLSVAFAVGISRILSRKDILWGLIPGVLLVLLISALFLKFWSPDLSVVQRQMQRIAVFQSALYCVFSIAILFLCKAQRYKRVAPFLIPCFVVLDIFPITRDIAQSCPSEWFTKEPAILQEDPSLRGSLVLHLGEKQSDLYFSSDQNPTFEMLRTLYPFAGLLWDVSYGAVNDVDRMSWSRSARRQSVIYQKFLSPQSLALLRQTGIREIISLQPMGHPELLEKRTVNQEQLKVYVYELRPPPDPFVRWKKGSGKISIMEEKDNWIRIQVMDTSGGSLVIARNSLVGWTAHADGKKIAVGATEAGWMEIQIGRGTSEISLSYLPPGLVLGATLSACGILLLTGCFLFRRKLPPLF